MKEYLISGITLSLITAIATHLSHRELLPPVKMAAGAVLLSFVLVPLGGIFTALSELELPSFSFGDAVSGSVGEVGEEAFSEGVAKALAQRFGASEENFVVRCEGFDLETLSADKIVVVMSGSAALLDYRAIENYIEENLEVRECECKIEIG
ncbi:MAG: hypothetical protein IJW48_05810 [Clostridia bacterium]|nr:hypothetical protein [Clostridia bacterium]MBQ7363943.1 hypothetical protein [Clostridia bacterium]